MTSTRDTGGGGCVRVFVCEPHPLIRAGLRLAFRAGGGVQVVGDGPEPEGALASWEPGHVDVALVTLANRWNGHDGLGFVRALHDLDRQVRTIVYSDRPCAGELRAAVDAGVTGYLSSQVAPAELADAIVQVSRGRRVYDPQAAGQLVTEVTDRQTPAATLTARETEVVRLMASGLTNAAIARRLGVSAATVKTLASRARTKLGASDRASVVAAAIRGQLIA